MTPLPPGSRPPRRLSAHGRLLGSFLWLQLFACRTSIWPTNSPNLSSPWNLPAVPLPPPPTATPLAPLTLAWPRFRSLWGPHRAPRGGQHSPHIKQKNSLGVLAKRAHAEGHPECLGSGAQAWPVCELLQGRPSLRPALHCWCAAQSQTHSACTSTICFGATKKFHLESTGSLPGTH